MLQVRNVVKSFGRMRAVDGVDLDIEPGTITGVIGPNGAGKSTLFNLIAGALAPSAGEITFEGSRIDGVSPHRIMRRGLARTFQIPRPFSSMSVLENAMLASQAQAGEAFWRNWIEPRRVAREEKANRECAIEWLGFCGLGSKLGQPAGTLSGGQQKLLELARVMMCQPRLILLDEPGAGVNPTLMETLVEKIITLNARGVTFLLIEHDMELVMRICSPLHVMAGGRVIFSGKPQEAQRDPAVLDAYLGDLPA